ncbi:MAG: hypothetical protein NZ988_04435 [Thaumarchaeota archaeon]|nr:hypothetical protein [Candidatus Calditenuaceae archaeon]MDW8187275.1 hypothetical protein [Nitrososphaerota archaeon]
MITLRERIELMRQGILRGGVIPKLEERGFIVSNWKRPVSLEDMELRDDRWSAFYSRFTSWETYYRSEPLYLYFNTFYGDVHEKAHRFCFVEYLLPFKSKRIPLKLVGTFSRLNLMGGGYIWKRREVLDLSEPDGTVVEIELKYAELHSLVTAEGLVLVGEDGKKDT